MTNEERDIITQFIARTSGGSPGSPNQGAFAGSVPATVQPALPPLDREADALIADLFQRYPEARYRITQLAFVQEHALVEAQNRIKRLEWDVQQAQAAAQQAQQAAQQSAPRQGGGIFGGLFGGGNRNPAPPPGGPGPWGRGGPQPYYPQSAPPPPQYPPNYQSGMFQQRGGSGFLGSALTTATGVAGGMLAANALTSLFSGGRGEGLGGAAPIASPWATPAASDQGYVDQGTWDTGGSAGQAGNQDYVDQGTWDQPAPDSTPPDNSGWDTGGGGWDSDSSGSSNDDTF
jgi:hypothetical protein